MPICYGREIFYITSDNFSHNLQGWYGTNTEDYDITEFMEKGKGQSCDDTGKEGELEDECGDDVCD